MRLLVLYAPMPAHTWRLLEFYSRTRGCQIDVVSEVDTGLSDSVFLNTSNLQMKAPNSTEAKKWAENACKGFYDAVLVSGWNDPSYRSTAGTSKKSGTTTICMIDNPYVGSFKQKLATIGCRGWLSAMYSFCWVAGAPQYEFARRLGYSHERIRLGLYTGDDERLTTAGYATANPTTLAFVGRLIERKGIRELVIAFEAAAKKSPREWILRVVGDGELRSELEARTKHEKNIVMEGALAAPGVADVLSHAQAFCLPSKLDHWGVALHEAALAGLPLVSTNSVYATTELLLDGFNGFLSSSNSVSALTNSLNRLFASSDDELKKMSDGSRLLSKRFGSEFWAAQLDSMINCKRV